MQLIRLVVKEKHVNISVVCSHSDSVTLGFVQCCLDNDCVGISDCLDYTKAFVFKEIVQQSNKATFIVLVTEECLLAGSQHSVTGALVMLCSHKSGRCAAELYHASHLWYPPFYTSPMASSALQH